MKAIPDIKTFFYETSLYEEFKITKDNVQDVANILFYGNRFDGYCTKCGKESILEVKPISGFYNNKTSDDILRHIENNCEVALRRAICKRDENHNISVIYLLTSRNEVQIINNEGKNCEFQIKSYYFQKIGQYPSIADLTFPQLDQYKKILGKQSREFHKAIGLFTHGIGIGSFVYLRRIFESIIEEAHQQAKQGNQCNEEAYNGYRVDEKIESLANYLPPFLVKNRKMYGILSKGIHELTEEECLEYFPIVKTGITLILDEKIREKEKEEEIKQAEREMSEIAAKLKN